MSLKNQNIYKTKHNTRSAANSKCKCPIIAIHGDWHFNRNFFCHRHWQNIYPLPPAKLAKPAMPKEQTLAFFRVF